MLTVVGRWSVLAASVLALVVTPGVDAAPAPGFTWHHATNPDPYRGRVSSVDCVRAGWCMFVDMSGQAVRYSDGRWDRPVRVEAATEFQGLQTVSCGSSRMCMALDAQGRVTTFNGTAWSTPAPVANGAMLQAVSCPSATFCLAVGNRNARWDGTRWHVTRSQLPRIDSAVSLSCASATFCMAVLRHRADGGFNVAWQYAHRSWSRSARLRALGSNFGSISCTSRSFCMAVGDTFSYERWTGTGWRRGGVAVPMIALPTGVSCTSSTHCVMAGTFRQGQSAEWNGHAWIRLREFHSHPPVDVVGVSCTARALQCLAVDLNGGVTWYRQHRWHRTVVRDAPRGVLIQVQCGSTMCIAADEPGGYVQTHGTGWTRPRRSNPNGGFGRRSTSSLSCVSDTFCLQIANNGRARRYDGTGWHPAGKIVMLGANLSCVSARWCAAMNPSTGRIRVFNGTRWGEPIRGFPDRNSYWDFSCGSRTFCVATSGYGYRRIFDGSHWTRPRLIETNPSGISAPSCVSDVFCMIVGSGHVWRYDGDQWHRSSINGGAPLGVSCVTARFCIELDFSGQVRFFDGQGWSLSTTLDEPQGSPYQDLDCASRSLCVVTSPDERAVIGSTAP